MGVGRESALESIRGDGGGGDGGQKKKDHEV